MPYNKSILELMIFQIGTEHLDDNEMIALEEYSLSKLKIEEEGVDDEMLLR